MPIARLTSIHLERDATPILRGVDWTIESGQHWVVMGANGCGKTTLLKVLTGYEWPTTGRVEVLGAVFGEVNLRELRRRIGWISSALVARFPVELTAAEVALSGIEASMQLWREFTREEVVRAVHALDAVGAGAIADRPWEVLSQGERQRALIARALVAEPVLLVLDEPCAGLDPAAREHFLDDLESLAARADAPTILHVTHHVEEVRRFATHALVMAEGRVLESGPVAEVLRDDVMTRAFGRPCRLTRDGQRWTMRVE